MSDSILERLADQGRGAPRVELRAAVPDDPALERADERRHGRYEILGPLAEGGVGEVMRGRDVDLGRDVAVKLLREGHVRNADLVQRFVEEAQIGGQLQHPGIVPVYELGIEGDRPFFSMKLVKGQTLAALLRERADPADGRRRLLKIFEQVCQTVAYAHSRGVVHRDLKPSNVMVGAFGEVQVLDWGFAKVLSRGGIADERPPPPDRTHIATLRSSGEGSASVAGSVMGTPAYMPPEQALGEVDRLDERSDVFSLGAILCEILTGLPPYVGEDLILQAAHARLEDAYARLAGCTAEPVLAALARSCLSPVRKDRPRDAKAVATRIHQHLAAVDERAHDAILDAERDRQAARQAAAQAGEDRRARRQGLLVAVSILLALITAGTSYGWLARKARERERRAATGAAIALREAQELRGQGKFAEAIAATERALAFGTGNVAANARQLHATLSAEAADVQRTAELHKRESEFLSALEETRLGKDDMEPRDVERGYRTVFAGAELYIEQAGAETLARGLRAAFPNVLGEIAACLDEWAWWRRKILKNGDWGKLVAVARDIDADPWRDKLRLALQRDDLDGLRTLAAEAFTRPRPVQTLALLGIALGYGGASDEAAEHFLAAHRRHPADFWINTHAAVYLTRVRPPRHAESLRFATAASVLRPQSAAAQNLLGIVLRTNGRFKEALVAARAAVRMAPNNLVYRSNLGVSLSVLGRHDEAVAADREALQLDPHSAAVHSNLAFHLLYLKRFVEAETACREAIRLNPTLVIARRNLATVLHTTDRLDEAEAAAREAIRIAKDSALAHEVLSNVLMHRGRVEAGLASAREAVRLEPWAPTWHYNLGSKLVRHNRIDEAVAALRSAIALEPVIPQALVNLSIALQMRGEFDEAIEHSWRAVRLKPGLFNAHQSLANALERAGLMKEAEVAARRAIDVAPKRSSLHRNLARLLLRRDRPQEAVEACVTAIRLDAKSSHAHRILGDAYRRIGKSDHAIEAYRQAVQCPRGDHAQYALGRALLARGDLAGAADVLHRAALREPQTRLLQRDDARARRMLEMEAKWLAVCRDKAKPADGSEALLFAWAAHAQARHPRAAQLYALAFTAGEAPAARDRYDAACAAARAATHGGGESAARWRRQAATWLRAELGVIRGKPLVERRRRLGRWRTEPDLAPLQSAQDDDDRRKLWAEIDAVFANGR